MTKQIIQNYKICILDEKGMPKYYLLFIQVPDKKENVILREFFSNVEWEYIQDKTENIFICNSIQIHSDDSVKILKQKIKKELQNYRILDINENDMYLFVAGIKTFQPLSMYKRLTNEDTISLTKPMLTQMMMNYYGLDDSELEPDFLHHPLYESKETFVYEDLLEFKWFYGDKQVEKGKKAKKIPLGFRFIRNKSIGSSGSGLEDLFCSNPFDNLFPLYHISRDVFLQSFELDFLFRYGDFIENTIYLCTYSDVNTFLSFENKNELLNVYFPYHTDEQQNNQIGSTYFWEEQELIDTIYTISTLPENYDNQIINYKSFGITSFHFIIHPETTNHLPLETIFKNIHASKQIPIIQFNPGLRRDKIYRLYYQQIAQNGNKIPFLKQETIKKLVDKPGKIANITMFVLINDGNNNSPNFIQISFELNGNIIIKGENIKAMMPDILNEWLREMIYPAIQEINTFTQSSGYTVYPFQNIQDDSIEIISLQYNADVLLNKKNRDKIILEENMGFFSPFFYNEILKKGKKEEGSSYKRYKRIEYFQQMNPHEEYISELLRFTQNKQLIKLKLYKRFANNSDTKYIISNIDKAEDILDNYADKYHNVMIPSRYTNNNIEMLEHTGFRCIFTKSFYDNEWYIEIKDINHLEYIYLLHNYLNTLFRISLNPELIPKEIRDKYKKKRIASIQDQDTTQNQNNQNQQNNNNPIVFIPLFLEEEEEEDLLLTEKEKKEEEEEDEEGDFFFLQEEEGEEEEEDLEKGGGKKKKKDDDNDADDADDIVDDKDDDDVEQDYKLDNLSNYFIRRIKRKNPLFAKSGLARLCPVNEKRQPIILTEEEKKKIDEDYPDPKNKPYGNSLKYGLDPDKKPLYYICPQYWCVKPGQEGPLTEKEVKQKKCGDIIEDPTNIKPGEYTYKGSNEYNDPGIINSKKKKKIIIDPNTGKEICYPCCYIKWQGKIQNERRFKQQCMPDEPEKNEQLHQVQKQKKNPEVKIVPPPTNVRNILAMNYISLPYGRIGLLPIQIQLFLNATTSNLCIDSNNRPKLNCPILVRYGAVQTNYNTQYFLGCLADIYAYQHKITNKVITIPEFREILCKTITLDKFVQLHNATLVSLFRYRNDDFLTIEENQEIDISKYENTQLYERLKIGNLMETNETHMDFFKSTILSYRHFIEYLRDENGIVDYTYLWEIICERNPLLFPYGMNLVILEILNNDITNNVELICPTTVYNFQLYDPTKETLILIKQDQIYEPIYLYEITSLNPEITSYRKTFLTSSSKDIAGLNTSLQMIQSWLSECTPSQKNKSTVFTENITATKIIELLKEIGGYSIMFQILNYQHKIIGFILLKKGGEGNKKKTFFLPVLPSASFKNIPTKWMDEPDIWNNYEITIEELKQLNIKSNNRILCKPLFRVIEDEKIVGIITMTNQFIQLMPYEDNRNNFQDGLKTLDGTNYMIVDMNIFTTKTTTTSQKPISLSELSPKEKMVQYIRLETQFYSAFRNTIRLQLNLYKSRKIKEKIQMIIFDKNLSFSSKLEKTKNILLQLMDGYFSFQEYDEDILSKIRDVFICQNQNKKNCNSEPYCLLQDVIDTDGKPSKCQLILPKYNLIDRESFNETIYFVKLSDELIRYKRIRLFMLYPENYLYLSNTEYKLHNESEFIIPKSELLSDTYFNEIETYPLPKYVNTNTYENAITTDKYANPTQSWNEKYQEIKQK